MGYSDKKDIKKLEKKLNILIFSSIMAWVFWTVLFVLIFVGFARADYLFPLKEPVYVGKKILCTSWYSKYRTENGKTYQYKALNYPSKFGTDILASGDGVVIDTLIDGYEGGSVTILYDNGLTMRFCHISKQLVLDGQRVRRGQVVAKVGRSGRTTGAHIRIVVEKNGERVFCNAETWGMKYSDFDYSRTNFDSENTVFYANSK